MATRTAAEPKAKPQAKAPPKPKAQARTQAKPKAQARAQAKPKAQAQAKPQSKAKPPAPGSALHAGDRAPAFSLESDSGQKVSLKDFAGQTVVLYFYPKDMTPGCTQEACDFRDSISQFNRVDAVVLGVSKDSVESHRKFRDKYGLKFPLLADTQGKACEAYRVWKEKSLYGRKFMGIERTTFVIDPAGRIKKVFPKVKVKDHIDEVLAACKE